MWVLDGIIKVNWRNCLAKQPNRFVGPQSFILSVQYNSNNNNISWATAPSPILQYWRCVSIWRRRQRFVFYFGLCYQLSYAARNTSQQIYSHHLKRGRGCFNNDGCGGYTCVFVACLPSAVAVSTDFDGRRRQRRWIGYRHVQLADCGAVSI